jgi:glycine cleavage system H protein
MEVTVGDNTFKIAEGYYYIKSHQWFNPADNTMGITDYAQAELGEISLVELSTLEEGTTITQTKFDGNDPTSDPIPDASIESAKTVADLYAPISGKVTAINEEVEDEPEKINEEPYKTWLIKLSPTNLAGEQGNTMDAAAYAEFLKSL